MNELSKVGHAVGMSRITWAACEGLELLNWCLYKQGFILSLSLLNWKYFNGQDSVVEGRFGSVYQGDCTEKQVLGFGVHQPTSEKPIRKRSPWSATRGLGLRVVPILLRSPRSQPKHTTMGCIWALQTILLSGRRQGCGLELSHLTASWFDSATGQSERG